MTKIRIGTRGSDLALWQTRWVCDRLRQAHPSLSIEQVIIKTHGDKVTDQSAGASQPVGAFVAALEQALLQQRVDIVVHSFKDLQTAETDGLTIPAIPPREVVHDVLLTREATRLVDLPHKARIGTGSPRRAAQLLSEGDFEIVPIRGNVPTRVAKIEQENLDGVVLAAAGLKRLAITHPRMIELPVDRFVPAPAQGALAVQTRTNTKAAELAAVLDHSPTRRTIVAERAFLRAINAGCHTPVGALASLHGETVSLHARLFTDDYRHDVTGTEEGTGSVEVGKLLAERLVRELAEIREGTKGRRHGGTEARRHGGTK